MLPARARCISQSGSPRLCGGSIGHEVAAPAALEAGAGVLLGTHLHPGQGKKTCWRGQETMHKGACSMHLAVIAERCAGWGHAGAANAAAGLTMKAWFFSHSPCVFQSEHAGWLSLQPVFKVQPRTVLAQ